MLHGDQCSFKCPLDLLVTECLPNPAVGGVGQECEHEGDGEITGVVGVASVGEERFESLTVGSDDGFSQQNERANHEKAAREHVSDPRSMPTLN